MLNLDLKPSALPEIASLLDLKASLRVQIEESGELDLKTGSFKTKASGVSLNHSNRLFRYINRKCDCKADPHLAIAISNISNYQRSGSYETYICPGKSVELGWMIENPQNVTRASIEPDGINISNSDYQLGTITVQPKTTTEYWLSIDTNKCKDVRSSKVTAYVAEPGTKLTISLSPSGSFWSANLSKDLYDPSMFMTSIQWVDCFTSAGVVGIDSSGVAEVRKIDVDGSIHQFQVGGIASSPGKIPVAGSWTLAYPGIERATANTCLLLTVTCGA